MTTGEKREPGKLDAILAGARDALTVRRVFGDPYERDGALVLPAAAVRGGGGGGSSDGDESGGGLGGGFGVSARPAGVYVIREGDVSWHPALDTTRVVVGGQVVAIVALLVVRSVVKLIISRRRQSS